MGALANMTNALAPGMGLNAFFTHNVVVFRGHGSLSYKLALAAVFVGGFVFVDLSLLGLRHSCLYQAASGVGI
jgi:AGZA family xanthine/uracil permease-like MFS transporter